MRHLPGISIVAALAVLVPAAAWRTADGETGHAAGAGPDRRSAAGAAAGARAVPRESDAAGATGATGAAGGALPSGTPTGRGNRQAAFALAARAYGVPEKVLLAVSYMESRWDDNDGLPSVSGGYGPMHLVDGQADPGPRHHTVGDPRGDETRPHPIKVPDIAPVPPEDTLHRASGLTGIAPGVLRTDPTANVQAGAALLADYQRRAGGAPSTDPARWYDAVARYSGSADTSAARIFADEVYAVIRAGATRVTDDGELVILPATPELPPVGPPDRPAPRRALDTTAPDCPATVSCEWIPAAYRRLGNGDHGNHDRYDGHRQIDYIVIHDGETGYDVMTRLVKNPEYLSWHYTLRSGDGHIAQHLRCDDVGWHAGNWYFNSRSIGLEHEGYVARGAWFTEAMYMASANLVRYLAQRYDIPLDRAHILGHDNVPGTTPQTVRGMHQDPGPYWDWSHYFELLGRPLTGSRNPDAHSVLIKPDYALNQPRFTGCSTSGDCPPRGSASVWLYSRPSTSAPLVKDIGRHPDGDSTYSVYDHAARASTGQRYALAGREGDWTAIWYLGQKAWFLDPVDARTSMPAAGRLVTPRPGLSSVKVYGRAYPEASAYPRRVPAQQLVPLQYSMPAGQFYSLGLTSQSSYLRSGTTAKTRHRIIRGDARYRQIQFGHRVMFVRASDVQVVTDENVSHALRLRTSTRQKR
ncbi:N-acetylmuramoyl-L-alanine amidase [Streptosporangium sp. NPDC051022]|uniref:N-acetylmuramoyl-L-alanine amidase n=1 Tax=Streptosporangium sp. NPDC051022 TaxID=3155752 RepID=UPI00344947F5